MLAYVFDVEGDNLGEYYYDRKVGEYRLEARTVHVLVIQNLKTGTVWRYRKNDRENTIAKGLARLAKADILIGHNIIGYDIRILKRLFGWAPKQGCKVFDTLVAARLKWPDAQNHPYGGNSLDALSVAAGGVTKQHYTGGFQHYSKEMEDYCVDDVKANRDIFRWLRPLVARFKTALKLEHRVAEIISRQVENGVSFDVTEAERLVDFFHKEQAECRDALDKAFPPLEYEVELPKARMYKDPETEELYEFKKDAPRDVAKRLVSGPPKKKKVIDHFNPGSTKKVADRLFRKYGWKAPLTEVGNPSVTEDTLLSLDFAEAQFLVRFNMAGKRLQHLVDWVERARNCRTPGRIHPGINTNGALSGRMTHMQPNQTACPKVSSNDDGPILGYAGRWGYEMRSLWGPREGWVQVGGDASGLELRMLGHYIAPFDGGEYIRGLLEGDIHTMNQEAGGLATRPQAKECIYAFLYGAGPEKQGDSIMHHMSLTPQQRKRYEGQKPIDVGKRFQRSFKKKTKGLQKLLDWVARKAHRDGYLTLPDGRQVPIRKAYAALNALLQGTGGIAMKLALVYHHDELIRRGYEWDKDFAYMLNAHDEFQLECRPEIAEEVGELIVWSIEKAGKKLKLRCPLTGEYKIGKSWAETH